MFRGFGTSEDPGALSLENGDDKDALTVPFVDMPMCRRVVDRVRVRFIFRQRPSVYAPRRQKLVQWSVPDHKDFSVTQAVVVDFCLAHDLSFTHHEQIAMPSVAEMVEYTRLVRTAVRSSKTLTAACGQMAKKLRALRSFLGVFITRRRAAVRDCLKQWATSDTAARDRLREDLCKRMQNVRRLRHQSIIDVIKAQRTQILKPHEIALMNEETVPVERRIEVINEAIREAYAAYHKACAAFRRKWTPIIKAAYKRCQDSLGTTMCVHVLLHSLGVPEYPKYTLSFDVATLRAKLHAHDERRKEEELAQRRAAHELEVLERLGSLRLHSAASFRVVHRGRGRDASPSPNDQDENLVPFRTLFPERVRMDMDPGWVRQCRRQQAGERAVDPATGKIKPEHSPTKLDAAESPQLPNLHAARVKAVKPTQVRSAIHFLTHQVDEAAEARQRQERALVEARDAAHSSTPFLCSDSFLSLGSSSAAAGAMSPAWTFVTSSEGTATGGSSSSAAAAEYSGPRHRQFRRRMHQSPRTKASSMPTVTPPKPPGTARPAQRGRSPVGRVSPVAHASPPSSPDRRQRLSSRGW